MLQPLILLASYTMAFLCFMAQYSEAVYPVTILDKKLKFSPRLFGVSTVVYNNEMYAYGGQTGLSFGVSNKLFKYSFDLKNKYVSMDTVNQTTPGPNCTYCGAVMISTEKMLILTHENGLKNDSASAEQVVKPYTFDLVTREWSVPTSENLPIYDESQKHVFTMRKRHQTILGQDGCIYVVGGTNFFNDSLFMQESWYYDPSRNEYGVLSGNIANKTRAHSSLVNLPDGNVGVLFGYRLDGAYYPSDQMVIINTQTKSWETDVVLLSNVHFGGEGITVQTDSNKNYAYFFGGQGMTVEGVEYNNHLYVLDLKNNNWLTTINQWDFGVTVKSRYLASSAIINDTFITVFGALDESTATEMGDLDIATLPDELKNSSVIPPQTVTVTWESQINQEDLRPSKVQRLMELSTFYITIATVIAFLIFIVFLFYSKVSIQKSVGDKKYALIPNFSIKHRAGELATTESYRIFVQIICVLIFGGSVGYLLYNTANSSVSETVEFEEVEYKALPDIRFCYAGYDEYNVSISIPQPICEYEYTQTEAFNCTNDHIIELPKSVHMPSFPKQKWSTKCYMYKSSDDSMLLEKYNPTALFSHIGGAYLEGEAVYVQFYEPSKNPNRVLFFGEDLHGLDLQTMDEWKDFERRASSNEVKDQIFLAYPESEVSVQFEVIHRRKIDPYNGWNYFGAFPQYLELTELRITHSDDSVDRGNSFLVTNPNTKLGSIRVTPSDFTRKVITEKRDTTIITLLGTMGGVAGVLFTAYALLFGVKPNRPWGFVHKTGLISFQKQKKLRQLEEYFDIKEVKGIPLVSPVNQRYADLYSKNVHGIGIAEQINEKFPLLELNDSKTDDTTRDFSVLQGRVEQLEGRNQILELVLRAYYIDVEIFQQLDRARQIASTKAEDLENQHQSQATCNLSQPYLLKEA